MPDTKDTTMAILELSVRTHGIRLSVCALAITPLLNRLLAGAPRLFHVVARTLAHDLIPLPLSLRDLVALADRHSK